LDRIFCEPSSRVRVTESDGIVADAAAGSDYIKLRKDAQFSERDLRVLEAHEGWVHVGTTLNGQRQPFCTFLAKGTPATTITQEGLALLVEILAGVSHPTRLRRITDRVHAIALAESGANFVEVFDSLIARGRTRDEAYATAVRVFRGSTPEASPFTKDLAYHKGFVSIYSFMQIAVRRGRLDRIPLLFCGKLRLEDVGTLSDLVEQQLVVHPLYLPPPVADLNGLSAWLAYSSFLERLDLAQVEADYARLLA
ncbi:MAG TPA: tyrosine/phenylalanine carboxypeptidase domain-containing protein, partial [Myxococcota bacterium]|nr:tyrosine/phenylalanine carboxypeptidase domain-containing protein [Myxococcota bacterium]